MNKKAVWGKWRGSIVSTGETGSCLSERFLFIRLYHKINAPHRHATYSASAKRIICTKGCFFSLYSGLFTCFSANRWTGDMPCEIFHSGAMTLHYALGICTELPPVYILYSSQLTTQIWKAHSADLPANCNLIGAHADLRHATQICPHMADLWNLGCTLRMQRRSARRLALPRRTHLAEMSSAVTLTDPVCLTEWSFASGQTDVCCCQSSRLKEQTHTHTHMWPQLVVIISVMHIQELREEMPVSCFTSHYVQDFQVHCAVSNRQLPSACQMPKKGDVYSMSAWMTEYLSDTEWYTALKRGGAALKPNLFNSNIPNRFPLKTDHFVGKKNAGLE